MHIHIIHTLTYKRIHIYRQTIPLRTSVQQLLMARYIIQYIHVYTPYIQCMLAACYVLVSCTHLHLSFNLIHSLSPSLPPTHPPLLIQKPGSLSAIQATPNASLLSATPIPPTTSDDLFSAHDFDIHIDLPTTPEGEYVYWGGG